jgi:hypothetical protein
MFSWMRVLAATIVLCGGGSAAAACVYGNTYGQEAIGHNGGVATVLVTLDSGDLAACAPGLTTTAPWLTLLGVTTIDTAPDRLVYHGYEVNLNVGPNGGAGRTTSYEVADHAFVMVQGATVSGPDYLVLAKEYYYSDWDHYFITADSIEQSLLGKVPFAQWQATGRTFYVYAATGGSPGIDVCRFFNESFAPKSTHFYGLPSVCAAVVADFPDWQEETASAFRMGVPSPTGTCSASTPVPVYRLYNNGQGDAPNHRFVTNPGDRADMLADGWISEGSGALGVSFCGPSAD